jgi:uncharacterized protein YaiI (UPF0178 family)
MGQLLHESLRAEPFRFNCNPVKQGTRFRCVKPQANAGPLQMILRLHTSIVITADILIARQLIKLRYFLNSLMGYVYTGNGVPQMSIGVITNVIFVCQWDLL